MAGHKMRVPPFVSLDYPLSCDTVDVCSTADIARRFRGNKDGAKENADEHGDVHGDGHGDGVEDMIYHAVECQRLGDAGVGWGPREGQDPCGIYNDTTIHF